jgi:CheY-like chemotaxis protein
MDILIVDDNESHRTLLITFLEDVGYTVMTAGDGLEALTYLRQSADVPKVILLDVAMPLMTGWEFVRAVQRDARFVAIPIVIMTALGALDHNEIPDGAVAFLEKPLDLVALEMILRAYAEPDLRVREVSG